jgi:hypothetical protein
VNPAPSQQPELKISPVKLAVAVAIEVVFVLAAVTVYTMNENTALLIALVLVGIIPTLWVVFSAILRKERPASSSSIVEDARGPRR